MRSLWSECATSKSARDDERRVEEEDVVLKIHTCVAGALYFKITLEILHLAVPPFVLHIVADPALPRASWYCEHAFTTCHVWLLVAFR